MLEMQLTGRKLTPIAKVTRWIGVNYDTWKNTGVVVTPLPATTGKTLVGTPTLPGYTYSTSAQNIFVLTTPVDMSEESITYETWVKMPAAGAVRIIGTLDKPTSGYYFMLVAPYDVANPGKTYAMMVVGNVWYAIEADIAEVGGTWSHWALVFERIGATIQAKVYVNGTARRLRRRDQNVAFTLDYAEFDASLHVGKVGGMNAPGSSLSAMAEFVLWNGIPGHIGKGKPTQGPIRDFTQVEGQVEVTGNTLIWTVPDGVTSLNVSGYGGGGGGSSKYRGGTGYYNWDYALAVTPGEQLIFNPGAGGGGAGSATTTGSLGSDSTIVRKGVIIFRAPGGGGGTLSSVGGGGANSTPTLKPGGTVIASAGTTGTNRGYTGAGGGIRALWGEGRVGDAINLPDV